MPEPGQEVRRRRVFYIPGYDPIPARRYRELYRKEGAAQAAISGYALTLIPGRGPHGWQARAEMDGHGVVAETEVLVWSDIVRASMPASIPATYLQLVRTVWEYTATGTLRRLMWLRKGPVVAALYPVAMLTAQLLAAILLALVILAVFRWLGPWPGTTLAGLAAGIVAGGALLRWFRRIDGRLFAYYLMHDYAFTAQRRGAYPPALEARLAEFGETVARALREEVDEVLIVGHSSGAHLAVSVLADLLRAGRVPEDGPPLALLSLGQVVPMVSFLRGAHRLRADLALLSTSGRITWVDVTAPGDGCAFALCDPVAVSGVAPPGRIWPLVISARFTKSLGQERWRALRWRFFRLHFQYLCAFDHPLDYDYFRITAGPLTLADRYAGKPPSPSRIDVPASKYTDTAP